MTERSFADDINEESPNKTTLFAVRTTIGQEKGVLQSMFNKLRVINPFPDIKVMMISEQLRGYVFVEATHQRDVLMLIAGLRHVKGKVVGSIKLETIAHVISPRRVTELLEEGDTVKIVTGIFQGQKAVVVRMPKEGAKEEVTLRLKDSDSSIAIKMHGDFLKLLEKGARHKDRYIMGEAEGGAIAPETPAAGTETMGANVAAPVVIVGDGAKSSDMFSFEEEISEEPELTTDADVEKALLSNEPATEKKSKGKAKGKEEEKEEEDEWSKFSF